VSLLKTKHIVKNTMSKPDIKETSSLRVLSKRDIGRYDETIGNLIGDLMNTIMNPENQRNYVKIVGPFMTIYHDQGYREDGADIELAIPITGRIVIDDPKVEVRNLQPARVASLVHKGPYETIAEGYEAILGYVQENGYRITGPMMDLYLNDRARAHLEYQFCV
jgi:effector-binding domain-containing protein